MTGKAAKAAETCPEFARKSAALFNPRARIAWNAAGKSVVVVGTLDPAKTIGLVCAGHVAGELPGATKHLHSDGGATTFEVHAATRPADAIDALFETFPEIRCVSASQLDPPAIKIPKIPKIPKTVFARCESLCLPDGLANAEAYATATKTIEAMTAAIAALTADYESRPRGWTTRRVLHDQTDKTHA